MKKTFLITGGAGFIGSNFISHVLDKYPEYNIINLDLLTYAGNLGNLKEFKGDPRYGGFNVVRKIGADWYPE